MKEEENQSVLFDQQVCDAFCTAYETTDTTRGERERLFWEWLNAEKAKAWREGAMPGFSETGEGWNGEYMRGIGEPTQSDIERENLDAWRNPYEKKGKAMKQIELYEQRMIDEYSDLKTRMDKLCAFLKNENRETLPKNEYQLLVKQYCAMLEYAVALLARMQLHGIAPREKTSTNGEDSHER